MIHLLLYDFYSVCNPVIIFILFKFQFRDAKVDLYLHIV